MRSAEIVRPPHFVGRKKEVAWLNRSVLTTENHFSPIIISGPAGIGKTSLLKYWFRSLRLTTNPLWLSHTTLSQTVNVETILFLLKLRSQTFDNATGKSTGLFVVIDDADFVTEKELENIIDRIYEYKIVKQLFIIRRQPIQVRGWQELIVGPLSSRASIQILQNLSKVGLTDERYQVALNLASGNPAMLTMLNEWLNGNKTKRLFSPYGVPIYKLSGSLFLPEKDIISTVQPIVVSVGENLIHALKRQPEDLRKLSSREFEVLLSDLLRDTGWDVEVTKPTRDDGSDILAYMNTSVGRLLCLVEAKHYREDRKVGVELVRTLYGTLCDAQANSAMLVTSSSFTKDAHDFQKKHKYQLSLRDYVDVVNWIIQFGNRKR